MKTILFICTSLLLLSFFGVQAQEDTIKVKIGQQVPEFEYEIAPGVIQNITDLKGKLVMITFFATWCGPCRQELPPCSGQDRKAWNIYYLPETC